MKTLLITGGAGFIGSNFIDYILKDINVDCRLINLDLLTYAGNLDNLKEFKNDVRHIFIKGSICDKKLVEDIFAEYQIDGVINFAAETHVDRSIDDAEIFWQTNVIGTQMLLNSALKFWKKDPQDKYKREFKPNVKFLQISTDEVYGTLGEEGEFTEKSPLAANSPYAASKAAADLLVNSYHKTYGLPINITRCSNNYGPKQFPEKLIPLVINKCVDSKPVPVYGNGLNVRDWLHVKDHCSAVHIVFERGNIGDVYNIGCNCEKANIDIVRRILKEMGKPESLIEYVKDRPGHDWRYAINNKKIINELNWTPKYKFDMAIKETIKWYTDNFNFT